MKIWPQIHNKITKIQIEHISVILILYFLILAGALAAGCIGSNQDALTKDNTAQIFRDVSSHEGKFIIDKYNDSTNFVIIDIRKPDEQERGFIAGNINIDYLSTDFSDEIGKQDKNNKYLIYGSSGIRSGNAKKTMAKLGFNEVYNLKDGINGWKDDGYPVEFPKAPANNSVINNSQQNDSIVQKLSGGFRDAW